MRDTREDMRQVTEIISAVTDDADELVRKPLNQTLHNSGKLLRPLLLLWAGRCGGSGTNIKQLKAAAALELLHVSSLIHDDIIDDGQLRRGEPCVHSVFGNSVAVYTGDYTIVKCYKLLHDSGNDALIYDFIVATEKLCRSDILQYQNRWKEISGSEYVKIARGKTGALFALALNIGAKLAGLDEKLCRSFGELGMDFGIAFQMADDCLDYEDSRKVNKSVGGDLRDGLYTMPLIKALQHDKGELRELLQAERNDENIGRICAMVAALGGVSETKREVARLVGECRKRLERLPTERGGDYFNKLLDSMEEQSK